MSNQGWAGHPRWAAFVRLLIALVPLAAGVGAAVAMAQVVPRPRTTAPAVVWWAASFAVSTAVMLAVASQARRLLPIATLLKLSMAFPDKTPSRFAVALRAGTIGNLKMHLAKIREEGIETEAGAAAETILILSAAMNAHDSYTRGHAERVRAFTEMLAEELGLDQDAREKLRWSSLLHDVGKVMVSPDLLHKTGPLDEDEWKIIHRHPDDGARIAAPLNGWLGDWSLAIREHHEKWDGTGYPRQLAGENISYAARIVAVADAFEVMTSARSYKTAMSATAARAELTAGAGSHFDPAVVRAFVALNVGRLRWVMGPLAWLTQVPVVRAIGGAGASTVAAAGGAAAVVTGAALGLLPPSAVTDGGPSLPAAITQAAADPAGSPISTPAPNATPATTAAAARSAPVTAPSRAPATTPPVPNRAPVANDDVSATQSTPSKPVKIALLANDADPDGDLVPGSVTVLQSPSLGKANVGSDGSVNYVPDNGASGTDSFVYRVCDSHGACDTATVTVVVSGPGTKTTR